MEQHYCTHPVIPGYAAPDPEVWAYLWENWYRKGRWELWARAAHDMIPILKTTMILHIKLATNKARLPPSFPNASL